MSWMVQYLCCLVVLVWCKSAMALVSYTADGAWVEGDQAHCDKYLCTTNQKLAFQTNQSDFILYDHKSACKELLARGVTRINFHGDSYMRQLYAGMLITLNGDYRYGSIVNASWFPQCEYQRQFMERKCGIGQLNHVGWVCDHKIHLDPLLTGLENLDICSTKPGVLSLWSFGNHKLSRYGRVGVNNATMYQQVFEDTICPSIRKAPDGMGMDGTIKNKCPIWWISTHHRIMAHFPDEYPHLVHNYNLEMRKWIDDRKCGPVNYIDVYNMTHRLVENHLEEAKHLSYDNVHWGMEVNLMKAQIVLNAMLNGKNYEMH